MQRRRVRCRAAGIEGRSSFAISARTEGRNRTDDADFGGKLELSRRIAIHGDALCLELRLQMGQFPKGTTLPGRYLFKTRLTQTRAPMPVDTYTGATSFRRHPRVFPRRFKPASCAAHFAFAYTRWKGVPAREVFRLDG